MPNTVRNESRPGIYAKLSTVKRWVEQCVCEWVVEGKSFRELDQTERLARMSANLERFGSFKDNRPKSKRESYLPPVNCCGEKEVMPKSETWTHALRFDCLIQARRIAAEAQQLAQNV